ncbi:unnamed protein product [Heterobilharzia americana]|nr:unnamed protein product [Heterobilharzia americana]
MTPVAQSLHSERQFDYLSSLLPIKAKANITTSNVHTMHETSNATQIAKEMTKYGMQVLEIRENTWNQNGLSKLSTAESITYSNIVIQTTTTSTLTQWLSRCHQQHQRLSHNGKQSPPPESRS